MILDAYLLERIDELALGCPRGTRYAGIGSRETPPDVCEQMTLAAQYLALRGFVLRSGGADKADAAFEHGAPFRLREIYLPWVAFNQLYSPFCGAPEIGFTIAALYHPNWRGLSGAGRKLMARNSQQILGPDCTGPHSAFVLCWTPDGADGTARKTSPKAGGTGQAIRIAAAYDIPVLNLWSVIL